MGKHYLTSGVNVNDLQPEIPDGKFSFSFTPTSTKNRVSSLAWVTIFYYLKTTASEEVLP
jgi:hypothetical protein